MTATSSARESLIQQWLRSVAAASAAAIAVIHLALAPEHFEERTYVGALFVFGAVVLLFAAAQLTQRPDRVAWVAGALICAGMFAGFLLARTVGLPGLLEEEYPPIGITSLVLELVFVITGATAIGAMPSRTRA